MKDFFEDLIAAFDTYKEMSSRMTLIEKGQFAFIELTGSVLGNLVMTPSHKVINKLSESQQNLYYKVNRR